MLTFRTVVLWIHLAAIVVWIGGMVVLPFVVTPVLRRRSGGRLPEPIAEVIGRFQRLSLELVFVILLTGIFNAINTGVGTGFAYSTRYLTLVGAKLVLFLLMAANQAWQSFVLIPAGLARRWFWSALVNAGLAAVVLYLGVMLRYG